MPDRGRMNLSKPPLSDDERYAAWPLVKRLVTDIKEGLARVGT